MIPAYCSTRWSVKYDILKAFADQAEEIFKVTANCHGHIYFIKNKLTRNDLDNAKEMIELLHPFKILTEVLSRKNNYPFVYVPVLIYMRDHLQKMNTKYATSDKFNPTKAIEKTIKYLRTTSNNNRILYLCGLFFFTSAKRNYGEYKIYSGKILPVMDMFVDIAYKLGDFDHLEVLNPEKEPASEFSLMLKEEVTKSTPASITSNSERQQFIKATL